MGKIYLVFSLVTIPNSFDPQLVESTGVNLLVRRATSSILHRTSYEQRKRRRGVRGAGVVLARLLYLEANG